MCVDINQRHSYFWHGVASEERYEKRLLGVGDVLYLYLSGRYIKVFMVLEIYQNVYTYNLYTFLYVDYTFLCVLDSVEFMQAQINITPKILE